MKFVWLFSLYYICVFRSSKIDLIIEENQEAGQGRISFGGIITSQVGQEKVISSDCFICPFCFMVFRSEVAANRHIKNWEKCTNRSCFSSQLLIGFQAVATQSNLLRLAVYKEKQATPSTIFLLFIRVYF